MSLTAPLREKSGQETPRTGWAIRAWAVLFGVVLLIISVAAAAAGWRYRQGGSSGWLFPVAFVVSAFSLICSVGVPLAILKESSLRAEDEEKCRRDCDDLHAALAGISDGTLRGLAQANFTQMRGFTVIAQRQARLSYYASLAASAISLFILITGAAAADGLAATPAKITAGSLAAAGAALSGFLAKTFLNSYSMASRQMSYYYGQPLVHCYLLHAEWLMELAKESSGNDQVFRLWQQIIEASLQAGASAQHHLLNLQATDVHRAAPAQLAEKGKADGPAVASANGHVKG
jgi:hypothetical protein